MSWTKYHTIMLLGYLCITGPIWFYLMYVVLSAAHVDRLVWFLYWVYVPVTIILTIIGKVADSKE